LFIEVVCADAALHCGTTSLGNQSRMIYSTVEGILSGPVIDDCLLVFIRRVFEELDALQNCSMVVVDTCRVAVRVDNNEENETYFRMSDIHTNRQLVLSTMKAAIVDAGEISLLFYMRCQYNASDGKFVAPVIQRHSENILLQDNRMDINDHIEDDFMSGFIGIRRTFQLTFRLDTSSVITPSNESMKTPQAPVTHPPRCFMRYPLDSLFRGIFFNKTHFKEYVTVISLYEYIITNIY
jgi:hypothetical protein